MSINIDVIFCEWNVPQGIEVDSYDVTIFPAETTHNSVTKHTGEKDAGGSYSTTFLDLAGGKTEYYSDTKYLGLIKIFAPGTS